MEIFSDKNVNILWCSDFQNVHFATLILECLKVCHSALPHATHTQTDEKSSDTTIIIRISIPLGTMFFPPYTCGIFTPYKRLYKSYIDLACRKG